MGPERGYLGVGGDSHPHNRAVSSFPITLSSDSLHSAQSLVLSIRPPSPDGCSAGIGQRKNMDTRVSSYSLISLRSEQMRDKEQRRESERESRQRLKTREIGETVSTYGPLCNPHLGKCH